ncbi:MAG: hypothetical protein R2942_04150 [Ignavibacteria bacterium]
MTSTDVYLKGVPVVIQNEKLRIVEENEIKLRSPGRERCITVISLNYYNSLNTISASGKVSELRGNIST